ncbi:3'-5' exoribonuclease domain-containing protein [Streptomyces sp. B21-083]|uniref:3'-5' exoribonuclease domain-containing protein n=1 Tax=Streptomyces sp. B21-083 TaxID=3039410 RepID=UPI002FF038CA
MTAIDYDLEFLEDGRTIELISIGMVCDDGREYYAVNSDMPVDRILNHQWLKANVWPHLPLRGYKPPPQINALQQSDGALDTTDTRVKPKWVIANEVRDFIQATDEPEPQLWADYGAYDHVALCQLWGPMVRLPPGVPMWTHDLRQEIERLGIDPSDLPQQKSGEHNALADVRHNQTVRRWLAEQEARTP